MHSRRLRRTIALASGSLSQHIREFWEHPRLAELYPEFLFATYGVICASTPLLTTAAEQAELRAREDETSRVLAPYLREHAMEEAGHDEWLMDDLARCGIGRERVLARVPYPSVAALAGAQFYWARHVHPVAMMGYLAVLENPASPEFLEEVSAVRGVPIEVMSTHLRHARLDRGHVAEFDRMLDTLPLTSQQNDVLATSAIASVALLDAVFEDVLRQFAHADDEGLADRVFRMAARADRRSGATAGAAVV